LPADSFGLAGGGANLNGRPIVAIWQTLGRP